MHFLDQSLADANFTTKDILNFLYTGPEEWREPGMAGFDWRNVFNGADQLIRLFNQYGEVSFPGLALESHSLLPVDKEAFTSFPISCLGRSLGLLLLRGRLPALQTGASVFCVCSREIAAGPL